MGCEASPPGSKQRIKYESLVSQIESGILNKGDDFKDATRRRAIATRSNTDKSNRLRRSALFLEDGHNIATLGFKLHFRLI